MFMMQVIRMTQQESSQDRKQQDSSSSEDTPPVVKKEEGQETPIPSGAEQATPTGTPQFDLNIIYLNYLNVFKF